MDHENQELSPTVSQSGEPQEVVLRYEAHADLLRLTARPVVFDGMIHGGVLLWGDVTAGQDRPRA